MTGYIIFYAILSYYLSTKVLSNSRYMAPVEIATNLQEHAMLNYAVHSLANKKPPTEELMRKVQNSYYPYMKKKIMKEAAEECIIIATVCWLALCIVTPHTYVYYITVAFYSFLFTYTIFIYINSIDINNIMSGNASSDIYRCTFLEDKNITKVVRNTYMGYHASRLGGQSVRAIQVSNWIVGVNTVLILLIVASAK